MKGKGFASAHRTWRKVTIAFFLTFLPPFAAYLASVLSFSYIAGILKGAGFFPIADEVAILGSVILATGILGLILRFPFRKLRSRITEWSRSRKD